MPELPPDEEDVIVKFDITKLTGDQLLRLSKLLIYIFEEEALGDPEEWDIPGAKWVIKMGPTCVTFYYNKKAVVTMTDDGPVRHA